MLLSVTTRSGGMPSNAFGPDPGCHRGPGLAAASGQRGRPLNSVVRRREDAVNQHGFVTQSVATSLRKRSGRARVASLSHRMLAASRQFFVGWACCDGGGVVARRATFLASSSSQRGLR